MVCRTKRWAPARDGLRITALGLPLQALRPTDLRARARTLASNLHANPGSLLRIRLDVQNHSDRAWPGIAGSRDRLVALRLEIRDDASRALAPGAWTPLPFDVAPRVGAPVMVGMRAPANPGRYQLVPCLGQEGTGVEHCLENDRLSLRVSSASIAAESASAVRDP